MKTILTSILVLASMPAFAGSVAPTDLTSTQPVATISNWQVRAAMYGWGTALDGDVTLRGNTVPVDAEFSDVFENLDFALMGALEVSNGKWSLLTDLFYAELSVGNAQGNRSFNSDLTQFIGNFAITRNLIDNGQTRLDIYAGARVNSIETDVNIQTAFIGIFSGSASETWVDPIIGIRFQKELSEKFYVRAVGDVGGFGVASDFTWQALLGIGYHVGESSSVLLGYRGIGTDYQHGSFGYDVISHGVLLGFECKF